MREKNDWLGFKSRDIQFDGLVVMEAGIRWLGLQLTEGVFSGVDICCWNFSTGFYPTLVGLSYEL